jgi:hypothetical protein
MINPFSVTTDIRELLTTDDTIKSFVGEKIFPLVAPDGTDDDFIVYQRDETKQEISKDGVSDIAVIVYITIVSSDYLRSQDIAIAVKKRLEGNYKGDFRQILMDDSTEDLLDRKYLQILQFKIK